MAPNIVILPAQPNRIVTGMPRPLKHPLIIPNTQRRIAVPTSTSCQPRIIPTVTSATRKRQTTNVLVAPKPAKRPAPAESVDLNSITELLSDDTVRPSVVPRKRQNLNHLNQEERQQRRMMMNRVAAQTARDRKKVKSEKLEDAVKQLIAETRYLRGRVSHLEQKLSEANAVIARNGNRYYWISSIHLRTPAVGTGVRGSTGVATGCGAQQVFHQGDEATTLFDYTSNSFEHTDPEFSTQQQMLIKELEEITNDLDLDELCNNLFEDGFPGFESFETETVDQDYHPVEKVQTETEYNILNTCELPSPSQTQFSPENTCDSFVDSTYPYEFTNVESDCFSETSVPAEFLEYPHHYQYDDGLMAL